MDTIKQSSTEPTQQSIELSKAIEFVLAYRESQFNDGYISTSDLAEMVVAHKAKVSDPAIQILLEALKKMLDMYWEGYSKPEVAMREYANLHPNSATATALLAIKKVTS